MKFYYFLIISVLVFALELHSIVNFDFFNIKLKLEYLSLDYLSYQSTFNNNVFRLIHVLN